MPVRIRKADVHTAMFSVPADAAQRLIDYSGLRVCQFRPGRAVVNLMLARYIDGDLGSYHEFGTCVMVNPPGSDARGLKALGDAAALHPPSAGRPVLHPGGRPHHLGLPEDHGGLHVSRDGANPFSFEVSEGGSLIAGIEFDRRPADSVAAGRARQVLKTYTYSDGTTREVPWEMKNSGVRFRPGGATLAPRRSPVRQGAGVAGAAEARDGVRFGRQRRHDVRRRPHPALSSGRHPDNLERVLTRPQGNLTAGRRPRGSARRCARR